MYKPCGAGSVFRRTGSEEIDALVQEANERASRGGWQLRFGAHVWGLWGGETVKGLSIIVRELTGKNKRRTRRVFW